MKRFVLLLPPLALAACNSGPSVTATNASVEEVGKKVAAANANGSFVSPGHWDSTVTIKSLKMPGMDKMPPEMAEKMKASMTKGHSFQSCVTEADAKAPKEGMFGGDKSCRYEHFTMAGGTIDAAMTCAAGGETRKMTIKGNYSGDAYHAEIASSGSGPMGGEMTMTIDAKRNGQCTGKEDEATMKAG